MHYRCRCYASGARHCGQTVLFRPRVQCRQRYRKVHRDNGCSDWKGGHYREPPGHGQGSFLRNHIARHVLNLSAPVGSSSNVPSVSKNGGEEDRSGTKANHLLSRYAIVLAQCQHVSNKSPRASDGISEGRFKEVLERGEHHTKLSTLF